MLAPPVLADFTQADSAKAIANCQGGTFISVIGSGKDANEAKNNAKADITKNIESEVTVITTTETINEEKDGIFRDYDKLSQESTIKSKLTLSGFKEIESPKRKDGKYESKTYICVKDAARGLLEQQRLAHDSLERTYNIARNKKHPKEKNEAWEKTQRHLFKFMEPQRLLNVLGVESPYPVNKIYSQTKADYANFCRNTKVFWQDAGNKECSGVIFERLSKKIPMEKSGCSGGFRLNLSCPIDCSSSSLEIECSFSPRLSIESCDGEEYHPLDAKEIISGSDQYKRDVAMKILTANLKKAIFLNEWEKEILGWVPQCGK